VPHITDEIQEWIERVAMNPVDGTKEPADVCVIELGGTIGTKPFCITLANCKVASIILLDCSHSCKYSGAGDKIFSPHNNSGILDAGDIESMPFIEALGQFSYRVGKETGYPVKTISSCFTYVFFGLRMFNIFFY
jgi:CTP synthase